MGMKVFNKLNSSLSRVPGVASINIGRKSGIAISQAATELINLRVGDKISLAQDEHDSRKWYVFKDNEKGFTLRHDGKRGTSLIFNSSAIYREATADYDDLKKSIRGIFIQPETIDGKVYYPFLLPKKD